MSTNLLSMAQQALGGDFAQLAGNFLGESTGATQSAMGSLLPTVLGAVARQGATADGASKLMGLLNNNALDPGMLGNLAGMFGGGGGAANTLMKLGSSTLAPALFGDRSGALVNALSSAAGIKSNSATNLIAMVVPLVFMLLKRFVAEKGLNANSLASLLSSQGPSLQGALDGRLTSALGFANPAGFLSGLGGQAADAALKAGSAVAAGTAATATAAKSGFMRWLPWLIAALLLLFLWNLFTNKPATPPAPAPAPKAQVAPPVPAPAPAAVTAPGVAGFPVRVYFDVGSAALSAEASGAITAAAQALAKDGGKVAVTGYTDRTGDAAKNEELAKQRAQAVRDALVAAGAAAGNIEMRPPMFVETGAAGSDAAARRVEITR